jgi:hypothetical protein
MRLISILIGTLILVMIMAWYLNKVFLPTGSNSVSTYESSQQQLDEVQQKVDKYNKSIQNISR